jgi:GTP-binding protein YchF
MSLSIGIVGLPNVGKSTLFNALTKQAVPSENYPFCTIDPSVGVVGVPDERLYKLAEISKSVKVIPAAVEFTDIAGLVKGAADGEGLGNKFLANIRDTDAIAHVVRIFDNDKIIHVHGAVNPLDDIQVINLELIIADLQTVENRIAKIGKDVKRNDKDAVKEQILLDKIVFVLKDQKLANSILHSLTEEELKIFKGLHLLTAKPMLYVLNRQSGSKNIDDLESSSGQVHNEKYKELLTFFEETGATYVVLDAATEAELIDVEGEEKAELLQAVGIEMSGLDGLIVKGYEILGLITYFTTGETESRAWTTKVGSTAPEAGTAIHTDFKTKFIKADVVAYNDLLEMGSYAVAREKGKVRIEGKQYIVQDGDVIEFKI